MWLIFSSCCIYKDLRSQGTSSSQIFGGYCLLVYLSATGVVFTIELICLEKLCKGNSIFSSFIGIIRLVFKPTNFQSHKNPCTLGHLHPRTLTPQDTYTPGHLHPRTSTPQDIYTPGHLHPRTSTPQDIYTPGHLHPRTSTPQDIYTPGHLHPGTSTPRDIYTPGHLHPGTSTPQDIYTPGHLYPPPSRTFTKAVNESC